MREAVKMRYHNIHYFLEKKKRREYYQTSLILCGAPHLHGILFQCFLYLMMKDEALRDV